MASKTLKPSKELDHLLNSLPDDVLVHILSFLPTKFAATTSVLSKRWRFLFHSVPHIELEEGRPSDPYNRIRLRKPFQDFVNSLLFSPCSSQLESLRLQSYVLREHEQIRSWIHAAIRRHVEELDLRVSLRSYETLPTEIFSCTTLRNLRVHGQFIFHVPSPFYIDNLVYLNLENVEFDDDECFNNRFPVLKRLRIWNCRMTTTNNVLELISHSLTDLILDTGHNTYKIVLHAPNLGCLEYSARQPGFLIVVEKLTILSKANIDFKGVLLSAEKKLVYGQNVMEFMKEIQNVKSLRLSGNSLEVLCYSKAPLPMFYNLTTMELGVNHKVGWQPLPKLLESAPNLEGLYFVEGFIGRKNKRMEFENSLGGIVPICLEHIREIKIGDFCGKKCEFEMVKYFLRKGNLLEEIKICSQSVWPNLFCERLKGYQRCSKTCRIVFCKGCIN